jgi:hypothetical protein
MMNVVRSARTFDEIVYTVGPDEIRGAVLAMLYDDHAASFTPETSVEWTQDGGAIVTTRFEREQEVPMPRNHPADSRAMQGHRTYIDNPRLISTRPRNVPRPKGHRCFILAPKEWR